MTVDELSHDQLTELKQRYLTQLSDEGCLNAVIYNKPELDEKGDGVSMGEIARADELVPDSVIKEHYKGTEFTDDDFNEKGE